MSPIELKQLFTQVVCGAFHIYEMLLVPHMKNPNQPSSALVELGAGCGCPWVTSRCYVRRRRQNLGTKTRHSSKIRRYGMGITHTHDAERRAVTLSPLRALPQSSLTHADKQLPLIRVSGPACVAVFVPMLL